MPPTPQATLIPRTVAFSRVARENPAIHRDAERAVGDVQGLREDEVAFERGWPAPPPAPEGQLSAKRPYNGLKPFQDGDEAWFFGREAQVERALRVLEERRFVTVAGQTGAGKTSFVQAGLIPALRKSVPARSAGLRVVTLRPGCDPLKNLVTALVEAIVPTIKRELGTRDREAIAEHVGVPIARSPLGLIEVIKEWRALAQSTVLVVVEDFDDLFRFVRLDAVEAKPLAREDEAALFVKLLLRAAQASGLDVRVAVTTRADALDECSAYQGLPEIIERGLVLLPRLNRDQRQQTILAPARAAGLSFDALLLQQLLEDSCSGPNALAQLQHCLARLTAVARPATQAEAGLAEALTEFSHRPLTGLTEIGVSGRYVPRRHVTMQNYKNIGDFEQAIAQHADEVMASLERQGISPEKVAAVFTAFVEVHDDLCYSMKFLTLGELSRESGVDEEIVKQIVEAYAHEDVAMLAVSRETNESRIGITQDVLFHLWMSANNWLLSKMCSHYERCAQISNVPEPADEAGYAKRIGTLSRVYHALVALLPDIKKQLAQASADAPPKTKHLANFPYFPPVSEDRHRNGSFRLC